MARRHGLSREETESLAVLFHAVENTNEGFVTVDENHRVLFFNRAAERIFEYAREEILGEDLDTILSPLCARAHRPAVERYLKSRRPRVVGHARELVATRKSGETFPCAISFSVARVNGRVFFTAIVRDLTETKQLQTQVARAERLAALGQTVAEIIHEIRNPLMIIGGFVRHLRRATVDPTGVKKLGLIASEVERLENLLDELRDLYLPRSVRRSTFDLGRLLGEVYLLAEQAAKGTGTRVSLVTDEGPARVRGDRERLKQVLLNIAKNGLEALGGEGNLRIQSAKQGEQVEVTIRDDGPGIPEERMGRIFSPFYTTKREGTGLGLSISKRIIDEHPGCSLRLESERGEGTTVTIRMPLHRKQSRARPGS